LQIETEIDMSIAQQTSASASFVRMKRHRPIIGLLGALILGLMSTSLLRAETAPEPHALTISGTRFQLNGKPFAYTGVSFFNAIYNPTFNADAQARELWLRRFQEHGITVLRVWCQWDNGDTFVDAGPASTLYEPNGDLREKPLATVKAILAAADRLGMCVELTLFSQESFLQGKRLGDPADVRAITALSKELLPYRNVTFQVWNEHTDDRVAVIFKTIKQLDPARLVTNSPGYWETAVAEISLLITAYGKPVVDDEPARNGTSNFGGPRNGSSPYDHIAQIFGVWRVGGYPTYHHDMFQTGYHTPACPPSGIPEPDFNPYHKQVFEFLGQQSRYIPLTTSR
jgi:hypothetical protein